MDKKRIWTGILAGLCMVALIFDGKTAIISIQDGIMLCLQTVIPALFPFFLLSPILTGALWGASPRFLKRIGKLCKIPKGAESLLVIGLLSGYPVGAQLTVQAYKEGKLSLDSARRMLGFCSNAGPAFIFGMLSPLFSHPRIPWVLWFIHIIGALIAGIILPGKPEQREIIIKQDSSVSLPEILRNATKTIATVCGWVLAFRLILGFGQRWFLWLMPIEIQVLFSGILELANGCVNLSLFPSEGMRFLYASVFLALGGVCVGMQTMSVTQKTGMGMYFPGKVIQALVSLILSCALSPILFT